MNPLVTHELVRMVFRAVRFRSAHLGPALVHGMPFPKGGVEASQSLEAGSP